MKFETLITQLLPQIIKLITEQVGPAARGVVNDKDTMKYAIKKIYTFLPAPVRFILSEEQIFNFCWENRASIFSTERTLDSSEIKVTSGNSNQEITENEKRYLEEIQFMLGDDGKIDEEERKVLEKKRKDYGISEERAKKLELSIINGNEQLSENEKGYLEDIEFMLDDDGKIDEEERKMLEKKRKDYGISEERAKKLELSIIATKQQFTPNERTYMDEVKTYLKDGEIAQRPREILERRRKKFDISQERSAELEEYCKAT